MRKKLIPYWVPLEWEELCNLKWGALFKEIYGNYIKSVERFTDSALSILQRQTSEDMWWRSLLRWHIWYFWCFSISEKGVPISLSTIESWVYYHYVWG